MQTKENTPQRLSLTLLQQKTAQMQGSSMVVDRDDFTLIRGRRIDQIAEEALSAPMLIENVHLIFIRQGEATIEANLLRHVATPGVLVMLGPSTIYQFEGYTSDLLCDILIVNIDALHRILGQHVPVMLSDQPCFLMANMNEEQAPTACALLDTLTLVAQAMPDDTPVSDALLLAVIRFVERYYRQGEAESGQSRQHQTFIRFLRLVNQHCRTERHLSFYADRMAMTQDYLSRIVRQSSGVTAKEWIERAVIQEAKVMLKHSDDSILSISESLHFPADSFFCKYFKRLTGMTPRQYREF